MPTNEKEYNGYLLDQIHSLKRIKKVALRINADEELIEAIDEEIENVNEKLYQKPPLTSE